MAPHKCSLVLITWRRVVANTDALGYDFLTLLIISTAPVSLWNGYTPGTLKVTVTPFRYSGAESPGVPVQASTQRIAQFMFR